MKQITKQNNLVPQLRFPEFDANWATKKLGDVTKLLKDGTHGTHKDISDSDIYLLSAKNIKNNSIVITDKERRISEEDYNTIYKNYSLKENDILLTVVGTIGQLAQFKSNHKIAFQRSVAFFRFYKNPDFFLHQFTANKFQNELKKRQVVSAQPGIYLNDLSKIPINLSSEEEQQKIASFLTDVDAKITKLTKKKELLEQYKKGIMQKIFNQELRFKDDNGNAFPKWEVKKLGEVSLSYYQGVNTTADKVKYFKEGYPILQAKHITNETIEFDDAKLINDVDFQKYKKKYKPLKNDLLISNIGTIGKVVLIKEDTDILIAWNIFKVTLNLNFVNPDFILFQLRKISKSGYFERVQTGNATKFVNKTDMLAIKFKIPSLEEQTKIANFLSDIDAKIEALNNKIENCKTFKKGLLQQMFV